MQNAHLSNSVHVAHATSFQRSEPETSWSFSPPFSPPFTTQNAARSAPHIPIIFPIKSSYFPFSHHESQRLEPAPIRHLIVVPLCRYPFIPPHSSESCDTSPNLLKYNIRKRQWHFGWHRECREEGRGHTTASPSTVRARSQTKDQGR